MTITVQPARNELTANAGQTIFNYTFKIFSATDLNVYITPAGQDANDSTDLTTALVVDPGTIGNPAGGFFTLTTGTNLNDLVTIVSDVPSSRTTDYQNNGDFRPKTVNDDFDRVVSIAKKVEDLSNRALLTPQSQQGPKPLFLPNPISQALMRWKNDLTGLENVFFSELTPGLVPNDLLLLNSTLAAKRADTGVLIGQVYIFSDRANGFFEVISGVGADNGANIVAHDTLNVSFSLILGVGPLIADQFGVSASNADNGPFLQAVIDASTTGDVIEFEDTKRVNEYLFTTQVNVNVQGLTFRSQSASERATIKSVTTSLIIFKVSRANCYFNGLSFQGDGVVTPSTITTFPTVVGVEIDNTVSGDSDARFVNCAFTNLETCIRNKGANLEVNGNIFGSSFKGIVQQFTALKESRDIRVYDNRFHVIGYNNTDASLVDSTCILIEDNATSGVDVNNNYVDNCRKFYNGFISITDINDNHIRGAEGDVITLVKTAATGTDRWSVSGNTIAGLSGGSFTCTAIVIDGTAQAITGGKVTDNEISTVVNDGISLINVSRSVIAINQITSPQSSGSADTFSGIKMVNCDDNTVANNGIQNLSGTNLIAGINADAASSGNNFTMNKFFGAMSDELLVLNAGNAIIDSKGNVISVYKPAVANAEFKFDANNNDGDRVTYARIRSQVSSGFPTGEKGRLVMEGGNSGSFNIGLQIDEDGKVGIDAATSPAPDAFLQNGSVTFYLTEGSNQLRVKVKESGGGATLDGLVSTYS